VQGNFPWRTDIALAVVTGFVLRKQLTSPPWGLRVLKRATRGNCVADRQRAMVVVCAQGKGGPGKHLVIGLGEAYFAEVNDLLRLLAGHAEHGPHGRADSPAAGSVGGGTEVGTHSYRSSR